MIEKTLAVLQKNRDAEIRIALTKYRANSLCDIRVYVDGQATPKGVAFKRTLMGDVGRALLAAAEGEAAAPLTETEVFGDDIVPPPAGDRGEGPLQPVPEGAFGGPPL
ncbi:MAG TPA: hypothetical protein QGH10_02050 [Armatimonadota bacterium]|nr:hypothetical protein [Armatimonadota bacterium]